MWCARAETRFRLSAKLTSPIKSAGATVQSTTGSRGVRISGSTARSKREGTRAKTRFGLLAKRTSPFKSAGVSVQSTTGSRGVRISGQWLYRPCSDVQSKAAGYPLHSHFPFHFPSRASRCAIRFRKRYNAGYTMFRGSVKSTGYPLYSPVSPSLPLPCVTVCHHISTGVYYKHVNIHA